MKLLPENELIWSWVVANSKMNRERNASGVNSYEKELKFKPERFLETHIHQSGSVKWLDMCCGQGKALIQAADYLSKKNLQDRATMKGVDLVNSFQPIPHSITCINFEVTSIVDWSDEVQYDLITCIHGLHYIGDKLKVLKKILERLSAEGIFMANLDLNNISIANTDTENHLRDIFNKYTIQYNQRTRMLVCKGPRRLDLNVSYKGASDEAGPNYTGQDAVCSMYELS